MKGDHAALFVSAPGREGVLSNVKSKVVPVQFSKVLKLSDVILQR